MSSSSSSPTVTLLSPFETPHAMYAKLSKLRSSVICLEGLIGVGKTTLGTGLESFINETGLRAKFFPERIIPELLNQYIGDMKRYAYSFQIAMLVSRIAIYNEAHAFASTGGIAIVDRSLTGDMAFAHMQHESRCISDPEWEVYKNVVKSSSMRSPDKIFLLDATVQTAMERIVKRGIEAEIDGYSSAYLQLLKSSYEKVRLSIEEAHVPLVRISWDKPPTIHDFVTKYLL